MGHSGKLQEKENNYRKNEKTRYIAQKNLKSLSSLNICRQFHNLIGNFSILNAILPIFGQFNNILGNFTIWLAILKFLTRFYNFSGDLTKF